ncbi:MAG TPA: hypothetical protein VGD78_20120 [Chthoniobacterales bacterium]
MNTPLKTLAGPVKRRTQVCTTQLTILKSFCTCAALTFALAQAGLAQTVRDEAPQIDDSRAPFVYEVKAELPSTPEELAGYVSATYRNSTDEFQQHSLLERIKPVIERRIAEAKAASLFMVKIGFMLPKYEFDRQGFRTSLNESSYVNFNNYTYFLRFTNWADLDFIPFEESKARYLEPTLHGNRQATLRIYGILKECREEPINGSDKKVIYLEATKAVLAVGPENRFAGQKIINSNPDATGTPVPSASTASGAPPTSPSDLDGVLSTGNTQNIEDDPRYRSSDDRLNQVYSTLRTRLSPGSRDQLKQLERNFLNQRERLKNDPEAYFAFTEQQIAKLEGMLNGAK